MRFTVLTVALFAITSLTGCKQVVYYDCGDGYEVPVGTVCDGYSDCYNGADEEMCYLHWVCPSGQLISPLALCDGYDDCDDGADEFFEDEGGPCVHEEAEVIACTPSEVLDTMYVCDGHRDRCDGNADEQYCTDGVTYLCDDGIFAVYVNELCDGVEQCPDGSDEYYCR